MNAEIERRLLPVLPIETLAFSASPDRFIEEARRTHPWLARFSQGYIVFGYQAACDLLADDENLIPGFSGVTDFYDARGSMWGRFMDEMLLSLSGPDHTRLRTSVVHAFTPRRADLERERMRRVITQLLDEWAPKGRMNFAEFASYFPVAVLLGVLGAPTERVPEIRIAMENQLKSLTLNSEVKPLFMQGWEVLWKWADELVAGRESSGPVDQEALLDTLIAVKRAGQMDETELRFLLLVLLGGGYDTSKNILTLTMNLLLGQPTLYERCASDKKLCGRVVTEALRYFAITSPYRTAAKDFSYGGYTFRKGDTIITATAMAGRDPAMFPEPLTFNPDRENARRHVAFGRGAHVCIGQFLARDQLQEGLHLIAQRLKRPKLDGEVVWRPYLGAWGLESLPITFEPAAC